MPRPRRRPAGDTTRASCSVSSAATESSFESTAHAVAHRAACQLALPTPRHLPPPATHQVRKLLLEGIEAAKKQLLPQSVMSFVKGLGEQQLPDGRRAGQFLQPVASLLSDYGVPGGIQQDALLQQVLTPSLPPPSTPCASRRHAADWTGPGCCPRAPARPHHLLSTLPLLDASPALRITLP